MKQFISFLLAITMALSLVPAGVSAQEMPAEETIAEEATAPETVEETTIPETEPESTEETAAETSAEPAETVISQWTLLDPDEVLTDGALYLYGISEENPVDLETVISMLPASISAGDEEIPVTWVCRDFVPGMSGTFIFSGILPEGYVLSREAAPVQVSVIIPQEEADQEETAPAIQEHQNIEIPAEGVAINAENFPDETLRSQVSNHDQNQDGILSRQELEAVAYLGLGGIMDTTGMEYFKNITKLTIRAASYTDLLDLSCFPRLMDLELAEMGVGYVNLSQNAELQKFSSDILRTGTLDFSGCPHLQSLKFDWDTQITTLKVNGCGELKSINCDPSVNIRTLSDVSLNTALTTLRIPNIPTVDLDLSRMSALEVLDLSGKNLSSLILPESSKLRELRLSETSLDTLDLKGQTALKVAEIERNKNLTIHAAPAVHLNTLTISGSDLSQIDLSSLTELQNLYLMMNHISSLDLSSNSGLVKVNLSQNPLTKLILGNQPNLTHLDVQKNQLTALDLSGVQNKNARINLSSGVPYYVAERSISLKELPGNPDPARILNVQGGELNAAAGTLTIRDGEQELIYAYDCGNSKVLHVTIAMAVSNDGVLLDEVHFPDPVFRESIVRKYDENQDGSLQLREINKVTRLYLYEDGLTSLKGLEYFRNIREFLSRAKNVTEVDLSVLDGLTSISLNMDNLHRLVLPPKADLTSFSMDGGHIKDLDLSVYPNLTELLLFHLELDSLDLQKNQNLEALTIEKLNLQSLQLGELPELRKLNYNYTPIPNLDLRKYPNLTSVQCGGNGLTTLDLTEMPNLEEVWCSYNELTSIKISPELVKLDCSFNQLKTISLPENSQLQSLDCEKNQLEELDLTRTPNLQTLYVSQNPIDHLDLSGLKNLNMIFALGCRLPCLNLSDTGTHVYASVDGNMYICDGTNGSLDLASLPGFDISKAGNWKGGSLSGTILTPDKPGQIVTYSYACNGTQMKQFAIQIRQKENSLFQVAAANMTLGSTLSMHFYVNNRDLDPNATYYAKITRSYADGRPDDIQEIPQSWWWTFGSNMKYFTYEDLAAKEMTDQLQVQIFFSNGVPASEVKVDSIQDYCMRIFDRQKEPLKIMLADMLAYGDEAQRFFNYHLSDLATARMTEAQKAYGSKTVPMTNTQKKCPQYAGSTLKLESRLMMDLYFQGLEEGSFVVMSYVDHTGKTRTRTMDYNYMKKNGPYRIFTVSELVVADCMSPISCRIYNSLGEEIGFVQDSPESYCARMSAKGSIYSKVMAFAFSAYNYLHNR